MCYRERVEAHTEAGAFPDSDNVTIWHKAKKGDIAGFYAKGEIISSLAPREWKMYWGLREVETENKLD